MLSLLTDPVRLYILCVQYELIFAVSEILEKRAIVFFFFGGGGGEWGSDYHEHKGQPCQYCGWEKWVDVWQFFFYSMEKANLSEIISCEKETQVINRWCVRLK